MRHSRRHSAARRLVLAALAIAAGIGGHALPAGAARPAVTAGDLGYPYPNAPDCNEQTGANCVKDQWGFVQGQCHSWVAYRLNELNATELDGETFGDHYHMQPGDEWGSVWRWDTAAQEAGVTMDDSPALGSLAWWSADGGHVAYVEAVYANGSVRISEMNADYHNGFDFARLTPNGRWPDAFLHVADRPALPAAPAKIAAVAAGSGSATVSWRAPASNGATITGYVVTARPGGATVTVAAATKQATFINLVNGRSYRFTVHATSDHGDGAPSRRSNPVVPSA